MRRLTLAVAAFVLSFGILGGCSASIGTDHVHSAHCGHVHDHGAWVSVGHVHSDSCGCHYTDGRWTR